VYSAQVAANAYKTIKDVSFDVIIIVAPSHRVYINGASIGDWDAYRTPLGDVPVSREIANHIRQAARQVQCVNRAHLQEHAVEVQIPFIQTICPDVPIVPLVVGQMSYNDCQAVASAIAKACKNKRVLLVASSDMSHYPAYEDACRADGEMLEAIISMDPKQVVQADQYLMRQGIYNLNCTMCGQNALMIVLMASKILGANSVHRLPYMNSGDISGDRERVVGYGAALFIKSDSRQSREGGLTLEEIQLTQKDKEQLFQIARESIQSALKRDKMPTFEIKSDQLLKKRGVFVTLTNHGKLRGCIGRFDASLPLYEMVSQMAAAAAVHDTRFIYDPVTLDELDDIDIKISILSPLKKIESIDEIQLGTHGIWIKQDQHSGTYLPEVATELNWTKEEFLSHCCANKAGLPADAWKKGAEIFIYGSQILDEKK
jgi:AmmeMemoRadiSam system protein B/AmmeMemoRadiSam system protein A